METSLYALHLRRGLHVRAEAGDRSEQGTERCWEEVSVCIYGIFGHVDVQSLQLRGQQLRARTLCFEGDTVSSREGCCSEGWCAEKQNNISYPQSHPAIDVPSFLRASWTRHHLSFAQTNTKVCAYQTALAVAAIPAPRGPRGNTGMHWFVSLSWSHKTSLRTPETWTAGAKIKIQLYPTVTLIPKWYSSCSLCLQSSQMETDKLSMTNRWHGLFPPWVPSDDKCSSELLLRRLHDNGQSTGFKALSQYYSSLQWFSAQFVSIFYSIGQDSRSGHPPLPLIHSVKLFLR